MAAKSIFVLCASVCLVKMISAQCIGAMPGIAGASLAAEELALSGNGLYGAGLAGYNSPYYGPASYNAGYGFTPSSGGGFPITSTSPIAPTGITVVSENAIEGPLLITGELPFLGAIALEGALPTAGAGAINYGCGGAAVGIVSEGVAPAMAPGYPAGLGYGPAGAGYPGLAGGFGYPGLAGARPFNGLGLGAGLGCGAIY